MFILHAEARNTRLKPRQLRRSGAIPGVLYGKSLPASLSVQVAESDAAKLVKTHSADSTVTVSVEGKAYQTLLREVAYTPGTSEIEHISFQTLVADEPVNSTATVVLINRDLVSGIVQQPISDIAYKALPADLIDRVEIDMAGVKPGDTVRVADLPIFQNPALEIQTPPDGVVLSVSALRSAAAVEEAIGEEATTGEEAAGE